MLVSLGVPTFNGARFLPSALDSLLAQDHQDLEIIISDNGSTDETSDICADYARRDERVRYVREPENRGAVWNFRRVLELSRGNYFAWHGDDDLRSASFVSATLRELVAADALLCTTRTIAIDLEGEPSPLEFGQPLRGDTPAQIIRRLFRTHYWADVYGLMRRDAVQQVGLRDTWGCDVVLTLELGLRGRVVHAPDAETFIRIDRVKTNEQVSRRSGIELGWNRMATELVQSVLRSPHSLAQRAALCWMLLDEMFDNQTIRWGLESERALFSTLMRTRRRIRRLSSIGRRGTPPDRSEARLR